MDPEGRAAVDARQADHRRMTETMRQSIDLQMRSEGFRKIAAADWRRHPGQTTVVWRWTAMEDAGPGYERIDGVTGVSRPSWSKLFSIYAGSERVAIIGANEPIYVRP